MIPAQGLTYGYRTAYQGLDVRFTAVTWNGYRYTSESYGPNPHYQLTGVELGDVLYWRGGGNFITEHASAHMFNDRLNLDPDHACNGLPNLMATCTPVIIDTDHPDTYTWTLPSTTTTNTITNETGTYNVTQTITPTFTMLKHDAYLDVNIYLEGSHREGYPDEYTHWNDAVIELEFTVNDFLYFLDNPSTPARHAIAYVALQDNPEWNDWSVAEHQSIYPGAKGETLGVYMHDEAITEDQLLSYEGHDLDPRVFQHSYTIRLGIDTFKPVTVKRPFDWYETMPSVKLSLILHVFTVGRDDVVQTEWVRLEPHQPQEREPPLSLPNTITAVDGVLGMVPWWIWTGIWIAIAGIICGFAVKAWHWILPTIRKNIRKIR